MTDISIFERKAEILKALAHPTRLCIVDGLLGNKCNVNYIQSCLQISQANTSQHLSKLKAAGIIKGTRKGNEICYEVIDPLAIKIVGMIKEG